MPPSSLSPPKRNIIFIHPDLGIGGAERLILDAALSLQSLGHRVTIYTSYRDKSHCFEEARDGTLDVRVRGDWLFPPTLGGRFVVVLALLRQVLLTAGLLRERREELRGQRLRRRKDGKSGEEEKEEKEEEEDGDEIEEDVFIVDQVAACVPILKLLGPRILDSARPTMSSNSSKKGRRRRRQRILFYCHFPDQLLARRDEGGVFLRLLKTCYRVPFDRFEGWAISAADKVVANSRFTRGVVNSVFGGDKLGDVSVVYPCVDTSEKQKKQENKKEEKDTGGDDGGEEAIVPGDKLWGGMKILLSINRFERKKNIGLAIRAYHALGEEGRKGTRLVIAGGYDSRISENVTYHKELLSLCTSLGLSSTTCTTPISALSIPASINVLFLLSVPSAFKSTLLASSALLLYTPSREHFGIVPVEAMQAGLPVLAVSNGGPTETVVDGETGWLRGEEDVEAWTGIMRKVLREMESAELAAMGRKGRERVAREFSLSAMGENFEREIEGMFEKEMRPFNVMGVVIVGMAVLNAGIAVFAAVVAYFYIL